MKLLILMLWISSLISVHCQVYTMTLNGEWNGTIDTCRKQKSLEDCSNEGPILQSFNAIVPGGIYTDLYRNGIIEDNLFGKNDVNNRWVGNQSVVYSKTFNVSSDFLKSHRRTSLIFYGIDTFANISLNDQSIFPRPSNMFLRYSINLGDRIKEGQNVLQVTFRSAVKEAEYLYNDQNETYKYIVPPVCVPEEYNGQCHVNHIRKMQASFSWDWGPAFPSMGIWRDVELVSTDFLENVRIYDVTTDIHRKENTWNILVTIFIEMPFSIDCHVALILYTSKGKPISNATDVTTGWPNDIMNISLIVPADAVENWWPNGYGNQRLYNLSIIVATEQNIAHKQIRVGFRTVELVEEPLEKGLTFYFRVNGVPIFAKGSNFVPASVFPELSAKEDTIRHLLLSAKEANMNMLRVWGGGLYESELFYDLADEYGIMIWQDFMFASAMYPTSYFLENVRQEIEQNVIRLKKHPSIVLWAGNNENEAALFGNWYGTGSAEIYRKDYVKLYVDLLKRVVEELDPIRPFLVSSPGNGAFEETYNYTGVDPYSNIYGDIHYFNYSRDGWNITQYPRPRFCSKYGFQSWPSMYTLTTAVGNATNDLHVNSDFVKHRQHMPLGNQYMQSLISRNFIIPQSNDSVRDFANYVYLSQINQAVSMRIQTESYRQAKSEVNSVGEGMTMGALYWQLNDVWQAPSWSSIDVEGRWKMLHYYAIDFFNPLIVTSHLSTSNRLSIYVVSDELRSRSNVTVGIHYYNWKSVTSLSTRSLNINIEANNATRVTSFQLDESLDQVGCGLWEAAKRSCIVTLSLEEDHQLVAPVHYIYPGPLKNAEIPVANVTMKIRSKIDIIDSPYQNFELVLSTDNIALFVWLETGTIRGHFSENGFHMFELEKTITFHAYEETTIELLQKYTTLKTLSDIYNPRDNFDDDYSVLEKQKNLYNSE